jgi:hypothetical protein
MRRNYFTLITSILIFNALYLSAQNAGNNVLFKGNVTIIGWEGDKDAALLKENGWFYIRDGVNTTASFAISAYQAPGKFKWYPQSGYLPCFVTEFEEKGCVIKISNFADRVIIGNHPFVIAYSRVSIYNPTGKSVSFSPGASSILTPLNKADGNVGAGKSVAFDYAVVTDRFGGAYKRPTSSMIIAAGTWDRHFEHMKSYWEGRVAKIVSINTPDGELNNAYRMGFVYTLISRDGPTNYNTAEMGYDTLFNHDYLGILTTLFKLGFYDNAREQLKIVGKGIGNYHDQYYRWCLPLSIYLQKTDDTAVLSIYKGEILKKCRAAYDTTINDMAPGGILKPSVDIDDYGAWTWDDESALTGFACYSYVMRRKNNLAEANKSDEAFKTLLANVNNKILALNKNYGTAYIPATLTAPNENLEHVMKKGSAFWATPFWFGMDWDTYIAGGKLDGPVFDWIDTTYSWGLDKMKREGFQPDNFGTWVNYGGGVSSGYNASFSISGLLSKSYRQEPIKAYQFLLNNGQSAPYGFWEMFHQVDSNNPWNGRHPAETDDWGACPHMWAQAGATQALLDALVAEFYDGKIIIGRGYLDEWCQKGKVTEIKNFPISHNGRLNVRIEFVKPDLMSVAISGSMPAGKILVNLPVLLHNIESSSSGTVDNEQGLVTLAPNEKKCLIKLKRGI